MTEPVVQSAVTAAGPGDRYAHEIVGAVRFDPFVELLQPTVARIDVHDDHVRRDRDPDVPLVREPFLDLHDVRRRVLHAVLSRGDLVLERKYGKPARLVEARGP